jgi:hypothetical protein
MFIFTTVRTSTYLWLYSLLLGLGRFFSFLIFYPVCRTPWTGNKPVARPLPAHRTAQTQNKCTQTSMPQVEFEPMIQEFERAKTYNALDRAASVIGIIINSRRENRLICMSCCARRNKMCELEII